MEINSDSDDAAGRARRQAKAEGLTLQGSSSSMTGYKGVSPNINANVGYQAFGRRAAKTKYLGTFNIAEEAALAVARFENDATPSPVEAKEEVEEVEEVEAKEEVEEVEEAEAKADAARRQAKAEGLTLQRSSSNRTGYKGVSFSTNPGNRFQWGFRVQPRFQGAVRHAGKTKYLGTFSTAEEAALAVARFHAQFDAASSATPSPATKSPVRWASHTSEQRPCARHGAPKTHGAWRREAEREARVWRVAGIPYGLRYCSSGAVHGYLGYLYHFKAEMGLFRVLAEL